MREMRYFKTQYPIFRVRKNMTRSFKYQYVFLALCFGTALLYVLYSTREAAHKYSMSLKISPSPEPNNINTPVIDILGQNISADDERIISLVRQKFLYPPSTRAYNLSDPAESNPSMGQAQVIDKILNQKKNGVFVECGGLDGETRSNTLYFEKERGWKGILIEADPSNFEKMLSKNRNAYTSPACLSPSEYPSVVNFQPMENMGHIVGKFGNSNGVTSSKNTVIEVQCFPLLTFIKALNYTTIDYFSLDVEGAEYSILKGIPWDQVDIKTFSIEYIHDIEGKHQIKELMESKDYILHSEVKDPNWLANDFIFVRKDIYYQNYR